VREPLVATTLYAGLVAFAAAATLSARSRLQVLGTGCFIGVLYLLRQETALLLPALVLLRWLTSAATRSRRLGDFALAGGAALLVVSPWLGRSWVMTGSPFFNAASLLFHDTRSYPAWTASRTLEVARLGSTGFLLDHPAEVAAKSALNLLRFGRDAVLLAGALLAPFFWVAVLRPGTGRRRGFILAFWVGGGTLIAALAPMEYAPRFLAPLAPLALVAAASTLQGLATGVLRLGSFGTRFWNRAGGAITVGLAAFFVLALVGRESSGTAGVAMADFDRIHRLPGAGTVLQDGVVFTDAPTVYAWVWDRPAVWAPVPSDLQRAAALVPGAAVVLTRAAGVGDGLESNLREAYRRTLGVRDLSPPGEGALFLALDGPTAEAP